MKESVTQMEAVLIIARTELMLLGDSVTKDIETEALEYCVDNLKQGHSGWRSIGRCVKRAQNLIDESFRLKPVSNVVALPVN